MVCLLLHVVAIETFNNSWAIKRQCLGSLWVLLETVRTLTHVLHLKRAKIKHSDGGDVFDILPFSLKYDVKNKSVVTLLTVWQYTVLYLYSKNTLWCISGFLDSYGDVRIIWFLYLSVALLLFTPFSLLYMWLLHL